MPTSSCLIELNALVDHVLGASVTDAEVIQGHIEQQCGHCITRLVELRAVLDSGVLVLEISLN